MIRYYRPIILVLALFITGVLYAQDAVKARPSPLAIVAMKHKDAYVKLTYSQPHKRGREVFGNLVPYTQVWRLGANEATEITLTRDMLVNNILLKAGTYSLFAIPEKEKWTMIVNAEQGLWGSYNYNAKLDVLRFDVPVQRLQNQVYEAFTITFDQKNDLAELLIMWDTAKISVPLKFIN